MAAIDLTNLDDVKRFLQKTDAGQDVIIATLITQASKCIMNFTSREFAPVSAANTARDVEWNGKSELVSVIPYDLAAATGVTLYPDEVTPVVQTPTQWKLALYPAKDGVFSYVRLARSLRIGVCSSEFSRRLVRITGTWGFPNVPEDVKVWCNVTVSEWLRRHVQAFSTVLNIDANLLERPEALPVAAARGLRDYRRLDVSP